jgi:hypothetical protein
VFLHPKKLLFQFSKHGACAREKLCPDCAVGVNMQLNLFQGTNSSAMHADKGTKPANKPEKAEHGYSRQKRNTAEQTLLESDARFRPLGDALNAFSSLHLAVNKPPQGMKGQATAANH